MIINDRHIWPYSDEIIRPLDKIRRINQDTIWNKNVLTVPESKQIHTEIEDNDVYHYIKAIGAEKDDIEIKATPLHITVQIPENIFNETTSLIVDKGQADVIESIDLKDGILKIHVIKSSEPFVEYFVGFKKEN